MRGLLVFALLALADGAVAVASFTARPALAVCNGPNC